MKQIYLIRHGIAQHNILFEKIGKSAFYDKDHYDTKLVEKGVESSINLGQTWKELTDIDLVLTSSLSRCLETSTNMCLGLTIPIIALDELKEYPQGEHTCNKRSNKKNIIETYSNINFENIINEEDTLWRADREETLDELGERIKNIKDLLINIKEENIVIISHNSFINRFMGRKIGLIENGDEELLHCHPYKYILK